MLNSEWAEPASGSWWLGLFGRLGLAWYRAFCRRRCGDFCGSSREGRSECLGFLPAAPVSFGICVGHVRWSADGACFSEF